VTDWDLYAPYYDWENGLTIGRRDVAFWRAFVDREPRRTLELGCGTGRLLLPLARRTRQLTGLDYSGGMLAHARTRLRRLPRGHRPTLVRADMRAQPFRSATFDATVAGYGVLQSLLGDNDIDATLAETARVLTPGGRFGIDLVPELQHWEPYTGKVALRGRLNARTSVTLVESVRQDHRKGLTIFDERFIERRGARTTTRRFSLTFRTLPMDDLCARIERAGFRIDARLGDYKGGAWTPESDAWILLATRSGPRRQAPGPRPKAPGPRPKAQD
jgi:ubiquinone/menaquinone biosynthesis C-methylase UbiE